MVKENFRDYVQELLNTNDEVDDIIGELNNVQVILSVYALGLQRKDFDISLLYQEFLPKNTPEQFHTMLAQMAILKSKKSIGRTGDYLVKNVDRYLQDFKSYFPAPLKNGN